MEQTQTQRGRESRGGIRPEMGKESKQVITRCQNILSHLILMPDSCSLRLVSIDGLHFGGGAPGGGADLWSESKINIIWWNAALKKRSKTET